MLSLVSCDRCLVVDDQLTVLPISSKVLDLVPEEKTNIQSINDQELIALKENMKDTQPVGCLVNCCKTVDQVIKLTIIFNSYLFILVILVYFKKHFLSSVKF